MSSPRRPSALIGRLAAALGRLGDRFSKLQITLGSAATILVIGVVDYSTGLEISLAALHSIPITITAWFVGARTAFALAVLSILAWIAGETMSGPQYSGWYVPLVNCFLRLAFYAFFVVAIRRLSQLQSSLESIANERATLLAMEIAERERLEHEMLLVSEREQRRIGQDLHDGLCQHLTGTALAGHALAERLAAKDIGEAAGARRIVDLVEEGISLARGMAKGLYPVEMTADGLMQALEEFAVTTSEMFGTNCRFVCDSPVLVASPSVATHLYRIAQEGVSNAIKHGRAGEILVRLEFAEQGGIRLTVSDDGCGFPGTAKAGDGMGLRIMADRAKMIGGSFSVGGQGPGGVELVCLVANEIPSAYA